MEKLIKICLIIFLIIIIFGKSYDSFVVKKKNNYFSNLVPSLSKKCQNEIKSDNLSSECKKTLINKFKKLKRKRECQLPYNDNLLVPPYKCMLSLIPEMSNKSCQDKIISKMSKMSESSKKINVGKKCEKELNNTFIKQECNPETINKIFNPKPHPISDFQDCWISVAQEKKECENQEDLMVPDKKCKESVLKALDPVKYNNNKKLKEKEDVKKYCTPALKKKLVDLFIERKRIPDDVNLKKCLNLQRLIHCKEGDSMSHCFKKIIVNILKNDIKKVCTPNALFNVLGKITNLNNSFNIDDYKCMLALEDPKSRDSERLFETVLKNLKKIYNIKNCASGDMECLSENKKKCDSDLLLDHLIPYLKGKKKAMNELELKNFFICYLSACPTCTSFQDFNKAIVKLLDKNKKKFLEKQFKVKLDSKKHCTHDIALKLLLNEKTADAGSPSPSDDSPSPAADSPSPAGNSPSPSDVSPSPAVSSPSPAGNSPSPAANASTNAEKFGKCMFSILNENCPNGFEKMLFQKKDNICILNGLKEIIDLEKLDLKEYCTPEVISNIVNNKDDNKTKCKAKIINTMKELKIRDAISNGKCKDPDENVEWCEKCHDCEDCEDCEEYDYDDITECINYELKSCLQKKT